MATRLYLPSSGASPLNEMAIAADWESSGASFFRAPLAEEKTNTALTADIGSTGLSGYIQSCWAQFVSRPLANAVTFTVEDTISMVVKGQENSSAGNVHLAYIVRLVSGDGATVRGTLASWLATSSEYSTTQYTKIHAARAFAGTVVGQSGDRIVVEIGCHQESSSGSTSIRLYFGDPTATADYALTANLTTDLCPWVELSRDLSFSDGGAPPADLFLDGVWG